MYFSSYPALLWGRWLKQYENAEPAVWKKCFRPRILAQIAALDDDDPDNDTNACRALASSLFLAEDSERASAIIALLFTTLRDFLEDEQSLLGAVAKPADDVSESKATGSVSLFATYAQWYGD